MLTLVTFVALVGSAAGAFAQKAGTPTPPSKGFQTTNVCERVTGESIATALEGQLLDVRPVNLMGLPTARCVYGIDIDDGRRTFVLWLNPASDYDGLRKAAESPKPVTGIGDAAHMTIDKDSKRYSLTATKRNRVTLQVTGDQADWVETIARLTLATFR